MNVRHPMGVLHSFSIKNSFYDKMDLQLFYFRVTMCVYLYTILQNPHYNVNNMVRSHNLSLHIYWRITDVIWCYEMCGWKITARILLVFRWRLSGVITPLFPIRWFFREIIHVMLTNCLSVFDHFVKLPLKGLRNIWWYHVYRELNIISH